MKHYEFTYLTKADMAEDAAKSLQDKLVQSVTAKNGIITDLPKAYKKRLAYRIKRQDSAYVNTILFEMEPAALDSFKKETESVAEILRGLVVTYKPQPARREMEAEGEGTATTEEKSSAPQPTPATAPAVKTAKEEPVKEEKKEAPKEEAKEEPKEEPKVEAKEEKIAKPKRKTKPKAELEDIEEKLEEILK